MRLKSIKLAGFKSFVDPTTVEFNSDITAIVGPNGCGKTNIVDGVRWVIGESSAKYLRGESLVDVIFNGTSKRKPIGQATIELIFDNSDASLGGQYAQYSEISVRRTINREAQSIYYLNNARCRRRDILDVFMGTGLGPRSYAVIEQGTISKLIEAKPEEMRVYLEEVAGISKYKERRRETENRIRHTRENLDRINDLREELEKQLNHLKRQSNAANRYKVLKQKQRTVQAQLHYLHWQDLSQQIDAQDELIRQQQIQLDAKHADIEKINAQSERQRDQRTEANDALNEVQSRYYQLGAEIARLEQTIQTNKERQQQLQQDMQQLDDSFQEVQQNLSDDQSQITELQQDIEQLTPEYESAKQTAASSKQASQQLDATMQQWQQQWDEFNHQAAKTSQRAEVENARIHQIKQRQDEDSQRLAKLEQYEFVREYEQLQSECQQLQQRQQSLQQSYETRESDAKQTEQRLQQQQQQKDQLRNQLDEAKQTLIDSKAKQTTLEALQQTALGKKDSGAVEWLTQHQLNPEQRLAEQLQVEADWEQAVEVVLNPYLEAVQVTDWNSIKHGLTSFRQGRVMLVDGSDSHEDTNPQSLAAKVQCSWSIKQQLNHVIAVDSIEQAFSMRPHLAAHESVVTKEGVWIGPHWLQLLHIGDQQDSILARKQQLEDIGQQLASQTADVTRLENDYQQIKVAITDSEQQRHDHQQALQQLMADISELKTQVGVKQARLEHINQQQSSVTQEVSELKQKLTDMEQECQQALTNKSQAQANMQQQHQQREQLLEKRNQTQAESQRLREQARQDQEQADECQLRLETSRNQLHLLQQNINRFEKQVEEMQTRKQQLQQAFEQASSPMQQHKQQLETMLQQHLHIEEELTTARTQLASIDENLRHLEEARKPSEQSLEEIRDKLEQIKMHWQTLQVKRDGYQEQLNAADIEIEAVKQALNEQHASIDAWTEQLQKIETRIQRMGAINLAAIEEYDQVNERKTYLDSQNDDLIDALTTLENAIRKIDHETRERFKETFEKVNQGLQTLFPKMFHGGHANLELTGDNLLDTGIIVKAQPPGKRTTSIHLLSGGEKALTTIALVFAMFQLNPAPFCILDEVDAPLDDVNVGRFCNIVKEMSQQVQFIFISHNKISIEMAKQLVGVTMHEAGVSRMVAVDIEEAIAMAE